MSLSIENEKVRVATEDGGGGGETGGGTDGGGVVGVTELRIGTIEVAP